MNQSAPGTPSSTPAPERDPRLDRLLALVDGVYAISLTLLAVELLGLSEEMEHLQGRELLESLLDAWPRLPGYITSFTIIALFWQANHQMFQHVLRFDGRLLWLVFLQLAFIAFLPFPTSMVGQHVRDSVVQQFYSSSLLVAALVNAALWWYASSGHRLVNQDLSPRYIRRRHLLSLSAPVGFLALMGLVAVGVGRLINPLVLAYLSSLCYIMVAVFGWWVPHLEVQEPSGGPQAEVPKAEDSAAEEQREERDRIND